MKTRSKSSSKRRYIKTAIVVSLSLIAFASFLLFLLPATEFSTPEKIIAINSNEIEKEPFLNKLQKDSVVGSSVLFEKLGNTINLWAKLKPGKYKIKKNASLISILLQFGRKDQLKNKLVIHKLRTREQLAELIGKNLECDAETFLKFASNNDSLKKWSVDTSTLLSLIIPDTYFFSWNAGPSDIIEKFVKERDNYWNDERKDKAAKLGLSPLQTYILASLVEEETTIKEDKPLIAGVYLNRYKTDMNLGSCPSVKFAIRDFSLRRILNEHVARAGNSPYNTYKFKGLPPGPICTPSRETLEAALSASNTQYLYFCAKANSGGRHAFAKTYEEHLENARIYQKWLDEKKIH